MKKSLLLLMLTIFSASAVYSQCVTTCSNYATYTVPYAPFPPTGSDAVSLFTPNTDDGYTSPISIGFNFNYYCQTYNTVLIYTNGMIQFNIGVPSTFPLGYDPAQLFGSTTPVPNALVAFRMDDLDPTVGGTVTYTTLGISPTQSFVVTYSNVPLFGNPSLLYSGQIVLHETTNNIDIITILAPNGSNLATQGIEDQTGTVGVGVPGRNQSFWGATSPDAWRFSPVTPLPPTSVTGTLQSCEGESNTYLASTVLGATSYNWYLPAQWTGTSTSSAITATAGASGQLSVSATYTCGTSAPVTISVNVIPSPVVSITSATPVIFCSGQTVTFQTSGAINYTLEPGPLTGNPPFFSTPNTTTTYSLIGVNSAGCKSKNLASTVITVKETPTVTVNSGSICTGDNFVMVPSGAGNYVYSSTFAQVTPTTPGTHTYSVSGTATNGCVSNTAISTVTVYALPVITASITRPSICNKETTSITAMGAVTYTWVSLTTNSTSTSFTIRPTTTNVYTVTGTDQRGCVNQGTVGVKVNPCTGVEELAGGFDMQIFPNPFKLEMSLATDRPVAIEIFNMLGQSVYKIKVEAGTSILNLRDLPSGNYFLQAQSDNKIKNLKIVKE